VLQEGVLWFSTEQGAPPSTFSRATVTGPALGGPVVTVDRPGHAVRPGRLVLWRAALAMFAAHPWLGVGPDNFRLLYGEYAGLERADTRTHSNNMYLEILAGGGLLGAAAFLWLMREAVAVFITAGRGPGPEQLALVAAGAAIALHGVVDSFISFAPTYILFSMTLGLAAAVARGMEPAADAHRI
jgi:O-antigen ligase